MEIRIDIPEAVLKRRFGRMPWLMTEDRVMPVVRRVGDGGVPEITHHAFRNIDKSGLHFPFRREFESRRLEDMRCFYTGSRLYLAAADMVDGNWKTVPWAATREHVAARRNNDAALVNTLGNLVPCGMMVNRMMAHMPLAVKLYERDRFTEIEFDRDAMSFESAMGVRRAIIHEIERPFWFENNYPWFGHAYQGDAAEAVSEFCAALRSHEEGYLALDREEQRAYLKRPLDLDLKGLARRLLGVGWPSPEPEPLERDAR